MERTLYTREEEELIARAVATHGEARCPRCGVRLERQEVRRPEGVGYRRARLWLACGGCGRSLVIDRRRIGDGGP